MYLYIFFLPLAFILVRHFTVHLPNQSKISKISGLWPHWVSGTHICPLSRVYRPQDLIGLLFSRFLCFAVFCHVLCTCCVHCTLTMWVQVQFSSMSTIVIFENPICHLWVLTSVSRAAILLWCGCSLSVVCRLWGASNTLYPSMWSTEFG